MVNYKIATPVMTSNTSPQGIVSASSTQSTMDNWKAFDNNGKTTWVSDTSPPAWLKYQFNEKKTIQKYAVSVDSLVNQPPTAWSFEGSNDGGTWTTLDTRSGVSWDINNKRREYSVQTPQSFLTYRIRVTSNMNAGYRVEISEFEMFEIDFYKKLLCFNNGAYYYFGSGIWQAIASPTPTESDYLNGNSLYEIEAIPESAWSRLTGDVELCYYTDDISRTEASFNIETTPFTLEDEWQDKTIKIIEYTDNPTQTESTITLETEPFTLYDELGDSVDVLYYTDDPAKTSAELEFNANYSPLDEITEDFELVTWTDDLEKVEKNVIVSALPLQQLILQPSDFLIYGQLKSIVANKIAVSSEGALRFVISFDSGQTWMVNRFAKWVAIDTTDMTILKKKGMRYKELIELKESNFINTNKIRIGYYLDESIHKSENIQIDNIKLVSDSPTQDVKFSNVAFYLLNTIAKIELQLQGNKLVGKLDDADSGRVQYRTFLNSKPYYPATGEFTSLAPSPLNISLNLNERDIIFGQNNILKVEFQDAWGQTDYWEKPFVGTYSGIMFMDENKKYYSNSFGDILKHLSFGVLIAGQSTIEKKVVVKNQMGTQVQNLILEVTKSKLPEGVSIELSRSNFPFVSEDPLLFNKFFNADDEFEFFVRIVTQSTAPPQPNGQFEIRAKADPV